PHTEPPALYPLSLHDALPICATAGGALVLFFTLMTTFFVLRHWTELQERAERMLPLHPMHTRVVMWEFQKVGKEVFIGTMLTGLDRKSTRLNSSHLGISYAVF